MREWLEFTAVLLMACLIGVSLMFAAAPHKPHVALLIGTGPVQSAVYGLLGGLNVGYEVNPEDVELVELPPEVVHVARVVQKTHPGSVLAYFPKTRELAVCYRPFSFETINCVGFVGRDICKLIEKVNDTTYRAIAIIRDDRIADDYLVVDFNVSTKPVGPYDKTYYTNLFVFGGSRSSGNQSGPLDMEVSIDSNKKDNTIIQSIANQIDRFAELHHLNNSHKVYLTVRVVDSLLVYRNESLVYIFDGTKFVPCRENVADSRIANDLLEGAICAYYAEWTASILSEMGIKAFEYGYCPNDWKELIAHARVAVPVNEVDVGYLQSIENDYTTGPVQTVNVSIIGINESVIIIEPQESNGDWLKGTIGVINTPCRMNWTNSLDVFIHGPKSEKIYSDLVEKVRKALGKES